MKVVILCAGYATRLYPFTIGESKSLLLVGGKPLLSYTIKNLESIREIDEIFVVTNGKFYEKFVEWKKNEKSKIEIINDKTWTSEKRLGGVIDLKLALDKCGDDDIFVILGDNYFNFDLRNFADFFKVKKKTCIALHDVGDFEKAKRFGVVEVGGGNKVLNFEEKPENPKSTLISTGCYIFTRNDLEKIKDYFKSEKNKEGVGYIVKDFVESGEEVKGFIFKEDWYDIGIMEDYKKIKQDVGGEKK